MNIDDIENRMEELGLDDLHSFASDAYDVAEEIMYDTIIHGVFIEICVDHFQNVEWPADMSNDDKELIKDEFFKSVDDADIRDLL